MSLDMKNIIGKLNCGTTNPAPSIDCYTPASDANGAAIIIFPGGGYNHLAQHEGHGYAERLTKSGYACFVVSYRLACQGHKHPAMIEDAMAAIYTVRSRAEEFNIDPRRIGVMGSSAGGHLAAHSLTKWSDFKSEISLRPDFGILCYPVITSEKPHRHDGSFRNLAGPDSSEEMFESLSCEKLVTPQTPPCFIWHTGEDGAVPMENSSLFAQALRRNKVPFELHLYNEGRHGLGLGAPFNWMDVCLRFLNSLPTSPS